MPAEDVLAHQQRLTLDDLNEREWVLFERHVHPPLYELILELAKDRNVHPKKIHYYIVAEEALPFITQSNAVAFLGKSGALRLTKSASSRSPRGIAIRPLQEDLKINWPRPLTLRTRNDTQHNRSKFNVIGMQNVSALGTDVCVLPILSPIVLSTVPHALSRAETSAVRNATLEPQSELVLLASPEFVDRQH